MRTQIFPISAAVVMLMSSTALAQTESESAKEAEIKMSPAAMEILCKNYPLNSRCQGKADASKAPATAPAEAAPAPEATPPAGKTAPDATTPGGAMPGGTTMPEPTTPGGAMPGGTTMPEPTTPGGITTPSK